MNQLKPLLLKLTLVIACVFLVFSIVKRIKYRDVVETDTDIADAITKLPSENFSVALSSFYFTNLTETQQIGKTISLNESFDNLYYNVNYPVFGIESIDVALKEDINQALSGFFTQFATYDAPNDASRAFLNIDYESYLVGDSIASVVYHILYDAPDYTNPIQEIHTRVFLLSTMEEISSDRVLTGNYLDLFSEKAIEYVTTHNELNQTYDYTQYQENLQPLQKNFEKFLITKDGVTLFFEPYTIAPGEYGSIEVRIPKEDVLPFFIYDPFITVDVPIGLIDLSNEEPNTRKVDPTKPMIALTFDDGPRKESTNAILDVLEQYNSTATFFVLGNRVAKEYDTIERAYSLGCDIANHSYSHSRFSTLKSKQIKSEISKTNALLKSIIGKKAKYVRTPYGEKMDPVISHINAPIILWDIDTLDWKYRNEKKIAKNAIKSVSDGDIILMHDIYDTTASAVEIMVPKLIEKGYQLVTISELLEYKNIKPEPQQVIFNIK